MSSITTVMRLWALIGLAAAVLVTDLSTLCSKDGKHWLVLSEAAPFPLQSQFQEAAADPRTQKVNFAIAPISSLPEPCRPLTTAHDLVVLISSGERKHYDWELDYTGFIGIGQKLSNPPLYTLQRPSTFLNFQQYANSFLLWYYPESSDPGHLRKAALVEKIAAQYHHSPFYFAQAFDAELREKEDIHFKDLPLFKRYGTDQAFDFNITDIVEGSLSTFVERFKWGLMPSLNTSLWHAIHRDCTEKVLILVFVQGSNYTQYNNFVYSMKMAQWAKWKMGDFRWQMAVIDVETMPALEKIYELDQIPAILSVDQRNSSLKLGYGYFNPDNKAEIERFLQTVLAGKRLARKANFTPHTSDMRSVVMPPISLWEVGLLAVLAAAVFAWCWPKQHPKRKIA